MNAQARTELVALSQIASQLLEWTDYRLLLEDSHKNSDAAICLHARIGVEGLELAHEESPAFQRTVCQLLGKLQLNDCSAVDIASLQANAKALGTQNKLDLVCKRALEKFLVKLDELVSAGGVEDS